MTTHLIYLQKLNSLTDKNLQKLFEQICKIFVDSFYKPQNWGQVIFAEQKNVKQNI